MTPAHHPDYKLHEDIPLTTILGAKDVVIADNMKSAMVSLVDRNLEWFDGIMNDSEILDENDNWVGFLDDICDDHPPREIFEKRMRDKWDGLSCEMKTKYATSFFNHEPGEVFGLYTISQISMHKIPNLRKRGG